MIYWNMISLVDLRRENELREWELRVMDFCDVCVRMCWDRVGNEGERLVRFRMERRIENFVKVYIFSLYFFNKVFPKLSPEGYTVNRCFSKMGAIPANKCRE